MTSQRRFKLIACEILFRELSYCISQSQNIIDVVFMPQGLHDVGEFKMSTRLQDEIDKVDASRYEAILLGYGLCNNGIRGLHSSLPIVVPRGHDCITLLLGSKARYAEYFQKNPGTFFKSTGWIERDGDPAGNQESVISQLGMNRTYQEYVAKYGEENARYLMDTLGDWLKNYKKFAYIDTPIGDFQRYKDQTREEAQERGLEYEEIQGSVELLLHLLNGEWDSESFLVVPPNRTLTSTFDDEIIGLA
jgi:hypothetical protein